MEDYNLRSRLKYDNKNTSIKFSFNLLAGVFGTARGVKFYSYQNKPPEVNNKFAIETKKHFEEKNKGFYLFVQHFVKIKKEQEENRLQQEKLNTFLLNFQLGSEDEYNSNLNHHSNRFFTTKKNETFQNKSLQAISIQKIVRGYLSKKRFYSNFANILKLKALNCLLTIQKHIRQKIMSKHFKKFYIINKILNERQTSCFKITNFIKHIHSTNEIKRNMIINKIVTFRKYSCEKIQSKFRGHVIYKKVKRILYFENSCYSINYPFVAKSVRIKIFINVSEGVKNED